MDRTPTPSSQNSNPNTTLLRSSHSEVKAGNDESLESSVAPLLGLTPSGYTYLSPVSFASEVDGPIGNSRMFRSTGKMSAWRAIGTSTTNGSPIPTPQNLFIVHRYPGLYPRWSHQCTKSLLRPSHLLPRNLQLAHGPRLQPRPNSLTFPHHVHSLFHQTLSSDVTLGAIQEKAGRTVFPPTPSDVEDGTIGTVDSTSRAVFYPQRTDPAAIGSSSPPTVILYNGLPVADVSLAESVSNIRSFIHSSSRIAAARNLRGKEAQELIGLIDQALALPELDGDLRGQCLHLLSKVSKACKLLPASWILPEAFIRVGEIRRSGGFADVSDGVYLDHRVAIKRLRFGTKDAFDNLFKQIRREIIGWKHLSHPNILPLLGVSISTDPRSFCVISDWMQNGNVIEYTKANPKANRLQLLSEVASGVTYIHDLGIVHADLKGANILVDDNGTARLADFGLATILVDLNTIPLSATTVSCAGTVPWTSPELLFDQNSQPTRQSDCYALGMVVYEILTGLRPFHHLGRFAVVPAVWGGERPKKPDNAGYLGLSDPLWRLVQGCWSEFPSARPTAQQLLRHLEGASHTWVPPLEYPIRGE